jgi:hypothetical protein
MRTTILLSSLLFLAGSALAQDSPITVGDSGRPKDKDPSFYVQHKQFQYNGGFFVYDPGYQVACFEMVSGDVADLTKKAWTLTLHDSGVVMTSTDGKVIDIGYKQNPIVLHNMPNGDHQHQVVGFPLKSGDLSITGGKTITYPPGSGKITPASPLKLVIHYCLNGNCKDSTGKDPCNPPSRK